MTYHVHIVPVDPDGWARCPTCDLPVRVRMMRRGTLRTPACMHYLCARRVESKVFVDFADD